MWGRKRLGDAVHSSIHLGAVWPLRAGLHGLRGLGDAVTLSGLWVSLSGVRRPLRKPSRKTQGPRRDGSAPGTALRVGKTAAPGWEEG